MNTASARAWMRFRHKAMQVVLAGSMALAAARAAPAQTIPDAGNGQPIGQDEELLDRPVSDVQFEGLSRVPLQKVLNNVRTAVGEPFDAATVRADVALLERLGEFKNVDAEAELQADGSVVVRFRFVEQTLINEVQVVGNRLISDQDLLAVARQVRLGPRDDFRIEEAKRSMAELYRKRGHYLTTVSVDERELERSGILIFRIIEGPRVRIRAVEFAGNKSFSDEQLSPHINTRSYIFIFRKGELDEARLTDDVAALDKFYKDHGYLDVRVDRQIELSPDNSEAKVTFLVDEGPRYTLRSAKAESADGRELKIFSPEQLRGLVELRPGDVFSDDLLRKSLQAVRDAYSVMGYIDVSITHYVLRSGVGPTVDLVVEINEGERYRVGEVMIKGNFITRDKVIRRELRMSPGRLFDGTEIDKAKERLRSTQLFGETKITVQDPRDDMPEFRDVLVEIKEKQTGSINFGVAVGSDSGLFGEISLKQDNFDVTDMPDSFAELINGHAFRGAGQKFNMVVRPGTELFQYSISLAEPHLFDTAYSGRVGAVFQERAYDQYEERRYGANLGIGRKLGDVWQLNLTTRIENVRLDDIEDDAPTEIFADQGPDTLTVLGLQLVRTTIGTIKRPGRGSRLELSFEQFGPFGGDFDFSSVSADYTVFVTLNEDFLGRPSILRLNSRVAYIFGGRAPTYERFYLGGRSLRGFDYRTVAPKGIRNDNGEPSDEAVGGDWLFFAGAQYEFPILQEAFTGVVFLDSGTVTEDPGFDEYRASIGAGIRLYIDQFGPVPVAFDFAFPFLKEDGDDEQVFSFAAEFPF